MNREKLIKKREALKVKRSLENRLKRINDLIKYLDWNSIEYCIHINCEKVTKVLSTYPAQFSGLDWDKISNSEKVTYDDLTERNKIIATIITQNLDASDTVFVTWSDGYKPILEIAANLAAENSSIMADEDFDMWVLNLEKEFCLEHHHEGYVAWTIAS
ncbi:MAG: hypothetical protein ACFCAD_18945 [Pleurocapsa sp.]